MKKVISAIESINSMVTRLSGAQREQRAGAEAVQRNVIVIRSTSQGQAASLHDLEQAIESLATEARRWSRSSASTRCRWRRTPGRRAAKTRP